MASKAIDRRAIALRIAVEGVANEVPNGVTPYTGMQYIVGDTPAGAFVDAATNDIAEYDGSKWVFTKPTARQLQVLDKSDGKLKRYNGTAFVEDFGFASQTDISDMETKTDAEQTYLSKTDAADTYATKEEMRASYTGKHETHVLTAAEITAKKFDLSHAVADASEADTWVRWESVDQVYGEDYTIVAGTGGTVDAVSWDGLGLDDASLRPGDIFKIQYEIEVPAAGGAGGSD